MAYATEADYEQYGNGQISAAELDKALERASDEIDSLTYNRIVARGFDSLSPFQKVSVKKAVCQQAEFVHLYGDFVAMPLGGYSAGSVSVSLKAVEGAGGVKTTEAVLSLLRPTGLINRGLC